MYKNKKSGILGIIITSILLIVLVIFSNTKIEHFAVGENIFSKVLMPIQNGLTQLKNKIANNNSFFTDINNLKTENEELKQKNAELEQSLRELEIVKAENEVLKEYTNMKDKYENYETVPAYIINRDISNLSNTMVINAGKRDGIEPNMAVISEKGLVGYIVSSTDSTSKIQPIIDAGCSVSANLSTSRDSIICKGILGSTNTLKAMYIPQDANLILGDNIETSGIGGIYPKGIRIGTLKEIVDTKNGIDRYAIITTSVDFSKIETVLVIK